MRQKSARSRKGERAEEAYLMLLPDLFFPSVVVIGSCVMTKGSVNIGNISTLSVKLIFFGVLLGLAIIFNVVVFLALFLVSMMVIFFLMAVSEGGESGSQNECSIMVS